MEHTHTWWGWINHHWFEISVIWFPALLGYVNAFAASCKVLGWNKLAAFLGKLEDAVTVFVATVKAQKQQNQTTTTKTGA